MMHAQQVITNAARVGARLGSQPDNSAGSVQTAVMGYCEEAGLNTNNVSTNIIVGSANSDSVVTVRYQFSSPMQDLFVTMARLITGGGPPPVTLLEAECTMRY
jgi:Flp pilus assembly protein TadG